jgi:hypothetical protein
MLMKKFPGNIVITASSGSFDSSSLSAAADRSETAQDDSSQWCSVSNGAYLRSLFIRALTQTIFEKL